MSKFSQQHYEVIASVLAEVKNQYVEDVTAGELPVDVAALKAVGVNDVCAVLTVIFDQDNPRFDAARFKAAAEGGRGGDFFPA